MPNPTAALPEGVRLRHLDAHRDARGSFTEIFRAAWDAAFRPLQWSAMATVPGTLRGVHVHPRHTDYLVLVSGRTSVGLKDLRSGSPTEDLGALLEVAGERPVALMIPNGVAHGIYYHEPSLELVGASEYWNLADELRCRWDDPALGIPWPAREALLSPEDAAAGSLEELRARLAALTGTAAGR
jgi:dTDP-4-dehydrorhamnose 3,5-epimerase